MDNQKREIVNEKFSFPIKENYAYIAKVLRKYIFKPYGKIICMRMVRFYQKHLSKHTGRTCKYRPTCSQYTMECINNLGWIAGILVGSWRLLRCNPFSKGGYDPAPENPFKKRWLL